MSIYDPSKTFKDLKIAQSFSKEFAPQFMAFQSYLLELEQIEIRFDRFQKLFNFVIPEINLESEESYTDSFFCFKEVDNETYVVKTKEIVESEYDSYEMVMEKIIIPQKFIDIFYATHEFKDYDTLIEQQKTLRHRLNSINNNTIISDSEKYDMNETGIVMALKKINNTIKIKIKENKKLLNVYVGQHNNNFDEPTSFNMMKQYQQIVSTMEEKQKCLDKMIRRKQKIKKRFLMMKKIKPYQEEHNILTKQLLEKQEETVKFWKNLGATDEYYVNMYSKA